ncbi:DUF4307 domain-containing protein [Haloactinopolyspora alba]|nr:DUF4307 domain-containing protein [Haloactinopolyspora alba]
MAHNSAEQADHLAERYGRRRRPRVVVAVLAAAFVAFGAVTLWLGLQQADQPIRADLYAWEDPRGATLPATVEIHRDPGLAVTCDLVAVDDRMIVVGQLELEVPAGPEEHIRVDADIPLEGNGIAPRLNGCHQAD